MSFIGQLSMIRLWSPKRLWLKMVPTSTRSERVSSRNPPERHLKSPKIASSSAAGIDTSIEQAEDNLNDLRMRRAAIFSETKDGMLKKEDKAVFWYREGRRQGWQAVASGVINDERARHRMISMIGWNWRSCVSLRNNLNRCLRSTNSLLVMALPGKSPIRVD